jgi:8-oxo-dGTP pyrophosphatase MutT (NUDIX family)
MKTPKDKIDPWKVLDSEEIFKTSFFRLRSDKCELPDGRIMPKYFVMEFADWVNVLPITSDDQVILIEQYRHAIGRNTYEIPGGALDTKSGNETTEFAALRELREETGYMAEEIRYLGKHRPNPATQTNYLHTYIALGCHFEGPQKLDPYEDIRVVTKPIQEVIEMVFDGRIEHSLIIASLFKSLRFLGFHLP